MHQALNNDIHNNQNKLNNSPAAPRDVPQVGAQLNRLDDLTMVLKEIIQQLEDKLGPVMCNYELEEGGCTKPASPIMAPLAENLSKQNDRLQASIGHLHSLINRLEI